MGRFFFLVVDYNRIATLFHVCCISWMSKASVISSFFKNSFKKCSWIVQMPSCCWSAMSLFNRNTFVGTLFTSPLSSQRKKIVLYFLVSCLRLNNPLPQPSHTNDISCWGLCVCVWDGTFRVFRTELYLEPSSSPIYVLFLPREKISLLEVPSGWSTASLSVISVRVRG